MPCKNATVYFKGEKTEYQQVDTYFMNEKNVLIRELGVLFSFVKWWLIMIMSMNFHETFNK